MRRIPRYLNVQKKKTLNIFKIVRRETGGGEIGKIV